MEAGDITQMLGALEGIETQLVWIGWVLSFIAGVHIIKR